MTPTLFGNGKGVSGVMSRGSVREWRELWGRPADVTVGPDGALYVSDDYADCVYRIYYQK